MGAPRRFFRRGGGFRGSRGTGGPPRRPYQDENQVNTDLKQPMVIKENLILNYKSNIPYENLIFIMR